MKKSCTLLFFVVLVLSACNLPAPTAPVASKALPAETEASQTATQVPTAMPETGSAVLLFGIGMHIEPQGTTHQGFQSGKGDYAQPEYFNRQVNDITTVTEMVAAHGGRMTIQAQSPFTDVAIASGSHILADLAADGHEIALHFHEDAHLGKNSSALPVEQWCDVMKEEIALVKQASGVESIRYWSGGNLYLDVFEAAVCAGLSVNSDWKNPKTQTTDLALVGLHPWRPAGGTDGTDLSQIAVHIPSGLVIFLPEGLYDQNNFASMRRSEAAGGDEAYFEYLKQSLLASVAAAEPGKVNVFHFTVHPAEFRGSPQQPFAVIEKFLSEVVDPLVASGYVQWVTFSEMADASAAWQQAHPGLDPIH